MASPPWILQLKKGDELLLEFPFTGNMRYAIIVEILDWGIVVDYDDKKHDYLDFQNYNLQDSQWENWKAYKVEKDASNNSRD